MDESRKVVRIFLASPGDLKEEREAAKRAVDELNQSWLAYHGYHVELVGWELTVAAMGRPQALINQDLATCEYFIGMVWKRWGTPPAKDGKHQSGFEEEFQTSVTRYRDTGKPEISLFFKTLDAVDKQDPGPQLQRVIDFKKKIMEEQELLFEEFSTIAELEPRIRRSIYAYICGLMKQEAAASSVGSQAIVGDASQTPPTDNGTPQHENPLTREGADFLRKFIAKTEQSGDAEAPTPVEVARFRLLGTLLSVDADDPLLAVHDANRIFSARAELPLSRRERRSLMDAGLAEYEHENMPLWHWFSSQNEPDVLLWRSLVGRSEAVKLGALSAMRDLEQLIPSSGSHPRSTFVEIWLGEHVPAPRRAAALRYLADVGIPEDLGMIRAELDRKDYQTSSAAIDAILKITLRESRSKAFSALLELQPDSVNAQFLASLVSNPAGIREEDLEAGISHRSSAVRLACVRALITKGALRDDIAEQLLEDSSVHVRLEAMKHLTTAGRVFSDREADGLLVVRERGGLFSIGRGKTNSDRLTEYRDWQHLSSPDAELETKGSIFNREAEFVLDERRFSRRAEMLRAAVRNKYKDKFDEALAVMASRVGSIESLIEDTRKLEHFVRQGHTRRGLDIICRRGDAQDLALVRQIMDSDFVGYSEEEISFIRRYGEWDDVSRIVAAVERTSLTNSDSTSVLSSMNSSRTDEKYTAAAKTIFALGRKRVDELFAIEMTDRLRRQLIIEMTDTGFSNLSDSTVMECFRSKDAGVRKAAALKAVRAVSRARQQTLLTQYLQEEYRFYNVLVWLDFGISMPRETARATAQRLLSRTWR